MSHPLLKIYYQCNLKLPLASLPTLSSIDPNFLQLVPLLVFCFDWSMFCVSPLSCQLLPLLRPHIIFTRNHATSPFQQPFFVQIELRIFLDSNALSYHWPLNYGLHSYQFETSILVLCSLVLFVDTFSDDCTMVLSTTIFTLSSSYQHWYDG